MYSVNFIVASAFGIQKDPYLMKSSWPEQDKEEDSEKCQSIYWNLINALEVREGLGTLVVNELRHTARCDHIHNLAHVRGSIEKEMTSESLAKVIDCCENERDAKNADRAIFHYHTWTKNEVYKGLSFKKKVYYHTVFHWGKWVAGFTLGGGLYKFAKAISDRKKR